MWYLDGNPTDVSTGTGDLVVKQARHPCLEVQDDINFIANDHVMLKGKCGCAVSGVPSLFSIRLRRISDSYRAEHGW